MKVIALITLGFYIGVTEATGTGNVALNKAVRGIGLPGTHEDTYQFLVDGDTSTCADSGDPVVRPGIEIDLGALYVIEGIRLTFPAECESYGCLNRNAAIFVDGEVCTDSIPSGATNKVIDLSCTTPMSGRNITLQKEGTNPRRITVCEFEVFGERENLASGKTVRGIHLTGSTEDTYPFLVDGDVNTCADSGEMVVQPGFQVDLGRAYLIEGVKLIHPTECDEYGCKNSKSKILVDGEVCADYIPGGEAYSERTVYCSPGPVFGRNVTMQKEGDNLRRITLCELQVF